jgi:mono/diheme cytochrome c family protein
MNRIRAVFFASAIAVCPTAHSVAHAATPAADSTRGAAVFESQSCIQCHALDGVGPKIGPDLGRLIDRGFTPAMFTSTMWNHAPSMLAAMRARNIPLPVMDEQAAADLFAFFYATRFFEQPGDAGRGKRLFTARACANCHGINDSKVPAAKPASQWTALTDPIAMIEAMWDHALNMHDEMARQKIVWPVLSGQDVADLLVYLRNLPSAAPKRPAVFQTTSGANGKALFDAKGCAQCHKSADEFLATGLPGQTMTDVAAGMWNHGREMSSARLHFEPGEMREIAGYIWSRRMFENSGNPTRGKAVFAAKTCGACHNNPASGAPALSSGGREFTDITMVSVLWRHGPAMLGRVQEKIQPWPRLDAREMSDLIAYLNNRVSPNAR